MKYAVIDISEAIRQRAKAEMRSYGYDIQARPFAGQRDAVRGVIAEIMFGEEWPWAVYVDQKSHDYELCGRPIEIKARKIKGSPCGKYVCVIPEDDIGRIHESAKVVFAVVKSDYSRLWFVGWLALPAFLKLSQWVAAGTDRGFTVYRTPVYEIEIVRLEEMPKLLGQCFKEI